MTPIGGPGILRDSRSLSGSLQLMIYHLALALLVMAGLLFASSLVTEIPVRDLVFVCGLAGATFAFPFEVDRIAIQEGEAPPFLTWHRGILRILGASSLLDNLDNSLQMIPVRQVVLDLVELLEHATGADILVTETYEPILRGDSDAFKDLVLVVLQQLVALTDEEHPYVHVELAKSPPLRMTFHPGRGLRSMWAFAEMVDAPAGMRRLAAVIYSYGGRSSLEGSPDEATFVVSFPAGVVPPRARKRPFFRDR